MTVVLPWPYHLPFLFFSFTLIALFSVFLPTVHSAADLEGNCKEETPPNFNDTFIANCRHLSVADNKCHTAWSQFLKAFADKKQTAIKLEDYDPYFTEIPIEAGKDQSLFWSGTFNVLRELNSIRTPDVKIVSSDQTTSSKILNDFNNINLCWCSAPNNKKWLEHTKCPKPATSLFWAQFSVRFARAASGTVYFMANGERKIPYDPTSFFGSYEIVSLRPEANRLVALNIHRKGEGEACNTGTFITLKQNATDHNLHYTCYDLYGNVADTKQTTTLAKCVQKVIGQVQTKKETGKLEVDCSSSKVLQVSNITLYGLLMVLQLNRF